MSGGFTIMKAPPLAAVLAVAALLAGCRAEAPPADGAAIQPCELISHQQLQDITGMAWREGVPTQQATFVRCGWDRADAPGGGITLAVHLRNVAAAQEAQVGSPNMQPVEGFGDAAWWSETIQNLVVRKGDRLMVLTFNFTGPEQRQWAERIAEIVVPRI